MTAKVLLVSTNRESTTYSRGPTGTHRITVADGAWTALNDVQKRSVVSLVWAATEGSFEVVDAASGALLGRYDHRVPPVNRGTPDSSGELLLLNRQGHVRLRPHEDGKP